MKWLLKLLVHFYRYVISPLLPNRCIYYPTCSGYALEALETHGAAKGFVLAVKRILSCNPLAKGGYDPVPEKGRWKNGLNECSCHNQADNCNPDQSAADADDSSPATDKSCGNVKEPATRTFTDKSDNGTN